MNEHPTHSWFAVTDIAGFSARPDDVQGATRDAFQTMMRTAVADAELKWDWLDHQWTGDGYLLRVPGDIAPVLVGGNLVRTLAQGLASLRKSFSSEYPIRVRLALHSGTSQGWVGKAVNYACHLVDTPLLKETLRTATRADLAVIASDHFHDEVIRPGHRFIDPAVWAAASVDLKEGTDAKVWLTVPGYLSPPLPPPLRLGQPTPGPARPPTHETLVGREQEMAALEGWFNSLGAGGPRNVIQVHGEAGVGKSALVARWAESLHPQQIEVLSFDFGGFAPEDSRRDPGDAALRWLEEIDPENEPPRHESARWARLREKLSGLRFVLLLDNVREASTVRSVLERLPNAVATVCSSRARLDSLGASLNARYLSLERLEPEEQRILLRDRLHDRSIGAETIERLAAFSAGLPLALTVIAARLNYENDPTPEVALARLADVDRRLDALATGDRDELTSVRVAFSWSYEALDAAQREAFRVLGIHPATESSTTVHAVAAMLGIGLDDARERLEVLERLRLISLDYDEGRPARLIGAGVPGESAHTLSCIYSQHDLLRAFAAEKARKDMVSEERSKAHAAVSRLYLRYVNHAFDRQNANNPMVDHAMRDAFRADDPWGAALVDVVGRPSQWFEHERTNFIDLVVSAERTGRAPGDMTALACSAFYFFESGRRYDEWDLVEEEATPGATTDALERARWLRNRGRRAFIDVLGYHDQLGENPLDPAALVECRQARDLLTESARVYTQVAEGTTDTDRLRTARGGEATARRELADVLRLQIDPTRPDPAMIEAARTAYLDALSTGDPGNSDESTQNWRASLELALAMVLILAGSMEPEHWEEAERLIVGSLTYASSPNEHGDPQHARLMAFAMRRYGDLEAARGRPREAATHYRDSARAFEDQKDALGQARSSALSAHSSIVGGDGATSAVRALLENALIGLRSQGGAEHEQNLVEGWLSTLPDEVTG